MRRPIIHSHMYRFGHVQLGTRGGWEVGKGKKRPTLPSRHWTNRHERERDQASPRQEAPSFKDELGQKSCGLCVTRRISVSTICTPAGRLFISSGVCGPTATQVVHGLSSAAFLMFFDFHPSTFHSPPLTLSSRQQLDFLPVRCSPNRVWHALRRNNRKLFLTVTHSSSEQQHYQRGKSTVFHCY